MVQFWGILCLRDSVSKFCSFLSFFGPRTSIWSASRPLIEPWKFPIFQRKNTFFENFLIKKKVKIFFLKIKKKRKILPLSSILAFKKACKKLRFVTQIWTKKASFWPKNIASNWAFVSEFFYSQNPKI